MTVAIRPTTLALLDIEENGAGALARALGVEAPPDWPPERNGRPYRDWQRNLLSLRPDEPGYAGYYIVAANELVGTCGFKGPPDAAGDVEIGYSIIAPRRRLGHATAAVRLLVDHAFADQRVTTVLAETLPAAIASQRVLAKAGFLSTGTRIDPEDGQVLRFGRKR